MVYFRCRMCGGAHGLRLCPKFIAMKQPERLNVALRGGYCRNCFALSHPFERCPSVRVCAQCGKRHHTMLHCSLKECLPIHRSIMGYESEASDRSPRPSPAPRRQPTPPPTSPPHRSVASPSQNVAATHRPSSGTSSTGSSPQRTASPTHHTSDSTMTNTESSSTMRSASPSSSTSSSSLPSVYLAVPPYVPSASSGQHEAPPYRRPRIIVRRQKRARKASEDDKDNDVISLQLATGSDISDVPNQKAHQATQTEDDRFQRAIELMRKAIDILSQF